jgi:hypothetical protein
VHTRALAFLAVLGAAPLAAQDSSAYEDLVAEMASNESFDIATHRLLEVDLPAAFRSDPNIAAVEAECPGAVDGLMMAATPMFNQLDQEGRKEYRNALYDLLVARMSAEDARAAAEFFGSDLGRRFVRSVSEQSSLSNSLTSAIANDEGSIDRDAFELDQRSSAQSGIEALSDTDKIALGRALQSSWGRVMSELSPEIVNLRYRITNADLTPEQNAALEGLMAKSLEAHFDACEAADH